MVKYLVPRGLCSVRRNPYGPARFTGNYFRWIAECEGKETFCDTRESARGVVYHYRAERYRLIRQGNRVQAQIEFKES